MWPGRLNDRRGASRVSTISCRMTASWKISFDAAGRKKGAAQKLLNAIIPDIEKWVVAN
jgi:hypothetical protein